MNIKAEEKYEDLSETYFLDCENKGDFSDPSSIVYGHNMKNGSMFACLKKLKEQGTYDSAPYFWILTEQGSFRYHIFSVFDTLPTGPVYSLWEGGGENFLQWERHRDCDPQMMKPDQKLGLEAAVGQLLEKQQRTLSMKYRDHLKNDEIGREMNRAAGTISGYTSRALSKLRWPRISAWYRDGYYLTVRQYLSPDDERAGICPSADGEVRDEDPCIAVGLHLKQYYALRQNGINTVGDLKSALLEADWFIAVRGIGPKTAKQIEAKLILLLPLSSYPSSFFPFP